MAISAICGARIRVHRGWERRSESFGCDLSRRLGRPIQLKVLSYELLDLRVVRKQSRPATATSPGDRIPPLHAEPKDTSYPVHVGSRNPCARHDLVVSQIVAHAANRLVVVDTGQLRKR